MEIAYNIAYKFAYKTAYKFDMMSSMINLIRSQLEGSCKHKHKTCASHHICKPPSLHIGPYLHAYLIDIHIQISYMSRATIYIYIFKLFNYPRPRPHNLKKSRLNDSDIWKL